VALTDEKAYEAAFDKTAHENHVLTTGVSLETLLTEADKDGDPFCYEIQQNLSGISTEPKLSSKKAKSISGASICVIVDSDARVGVYYGAKGAVGSSDDDFNLGAATKPQS
jgi:hypothetical protein